MGAEKKGFEAGPKEFDMRALNKVISIEQTLQKLSKDPLYALAAKEMHSKLKSFELESPDDAEEAIYAIRKYAESTGNKDLWDIVEEKMEDEKPKTIQPAAKTEARELTREEKTEVAINQAKKKVQELIDSLTSTLETASAGMFAVTLDISGSEAVNKSEQSIKEIVRRNQEMLDRATEIKTVLDNLIPGGNINQLRTTVQMMVKGIDVQKTSLQEAWFLANTLKTLEKNLS